MHYITFLGPVGATFSHDAYSLLSEIYLVPKPEMGADSNCIPASTNGEILGLIARHGGYGTIAMETLAEGRVAEPLESFIDLLRSYKDIRECPFHVVGAIELQLHFCLMARKGMSLQSIRKIIAHPKALGACKDRVASSSIPTMSVASNGEAARLVAEQEDYRNCAALGPKSASDKYGLNILNEAFEDQEAITTFFLIAPKKHKVAVGEKNRSLIVFKVPHEPGALVKALQVFERQHLNLVQIHSVHAGNHNYNFAIELNVERKRLDALHRAMRMLEHCVERHLAFGPFEVLAKYHGFLKSGRRGQK
jgi:prephenate dehydratase